VHPAVPRARILLGKYLDTVIVLLTPFTAGVLSNLMVIGLGGAVPLEAGLVGRVLVSFLVSIVYISVFALLGLFLSAHSKTPVVSLVTGLLVWVFCDRRSRKRKFDRQGPGRNTDGGSRE
jgi:ABC-type transport system involved in multi-copper enzyme maturation permease subunit